MPFCYPSSHSTHHTGMALPDYPTTVTHQHRSSLRFSFLPPSPFLFILFMQVSSLALHGCQTFYLHADLDVLPQLCPLQHSNRRVKYSWVVQLTHRAAHSSLRGNVYFMVGISSLSFNYIHLFISYNGANIFNFSVCVCGTG